jgi:N-acetylglucosaminyl-diphospho-decaprenol L-rhamnosyltransferase
MADLSVIVVTHDGREMALRTLRSVQSATGGLDCEWIVVDSGSRDGTPDAIAAAFPDVWLERRANIGFAASNNVGLKLATGRHVLFLNPDVEIVDGDLAALVTELERRPATGAASVIQVDGDGHLLPSMLRFPTPLRQAAEALLPPRVRPARLDEPVAPGPVYEKEQTADWLTGAFLLVRGEAVRAAGGMDERFFLYSEETDLCLRLHRAGWEVRHLPVMTIRHHGGTSQTPFLAAQLCRSKLLYAAKHYGRLGRAATRVSLVTGHAMRLAMAATLRWRPEARRRLAAERAALIVAISG